MESKANQMNQRVEPVIWKTKQQKTPNWKNKKKKELKGKAALKKDTQPDLSKGQERSTREKNIPKKTAMQRS